MTWGDWLPIQRWLHDATIDRDLQAPLSKARAEFTDWTEEEVRAIWRGFQSIIDLWIQAHPEEARQCVRERQLDFHVPKTGPVRIGRASTIYDNAAIVDHMLNTKYAPFIAEFRKLHKELPLALSQALAVLVLHEAAFQNTDGAIHASGMMDRVYKFVRPLAKIGYESKTHRRKGGTKSGETRRFDTKLRNDRIARAAEQLLDDGESPHCVAALVSERFGLEPGARQVRRILQDRGILKKRT